MILEIVCLGWFVLSPLVGIIIGKGINLADRAGVE